MKAPKAKPIVSINHAYAKLATRVKSQSGQAFPILGIGAALSAIVGFFGDIIVFFGIGFVLMWVILEHFKPGTTKYISIGLANWIGSVLKAATPIVTELSGDLDGIVKAFITAFKSSGGPIANDLKQPIEDVVRFGFQTVTGDLLNRGQATPDKWAGNAADAMATAFGFGLSSFGVTLAFESLFPEKLNTLNGLGPMLATLAGFEEVTKASLGPTFDAAISRPASYDALNRTRPVLPNAGEALGLFARRLAPSKDVDTWLGYAGFSGPVIDRLKAGSYRPVSPFIVARAVTDTSFDRPKFEELMRFAGYREQDISTVIDALIYASERNLRQSYLNAAISGAGKGLLNDSDLAGVMDDVKLSDDAKNLVQKHVAILRIERTVTEYMASLLTKVKDGVISIDEYQLALTGLGLDPHEVTAEVAKADAIVNGQILKAERADAQKAIRKIQELSIQNGILAFKKGDIDAVELAAFLFTLGLSPALVALYVSLAELKVQPAPPKKKP